MTSRDYAKIAAVLYNMRYSSASTIEEYWELLVQAFCEMLEQDNPRFDAALFRDACLGKKK